MVHEVIIKKHPIYWFEDGSLILDVANHRYKVHHTLVARHSTFFSADTTLAKDGGRKDTRQGGKESDGTMQNISVGSSPLIHAHVILEPERQVNPEDIEALLKHLYHDVMGYRDAFEFFCGHMLTISQRPLDSDTSFPHLLSLLRVCSPRQLDFPNIHLAARRIFEAAFPSNPEAFTHNHPLHEALPIAKSLNIPHVTKAIFYSLVSTTDFDVSGPPLHANSGQESSKESQPRQDLSLDDQGSKQAPQSKIVPSKTLSPADSRTCLNLMNRLIDHFTPILFTPPATSHMECTDVFAETWMPLVIQPAIENDGVYKPLETLQRNKELDWVKHGMCASCVAEKVEEWSKEQRYIWKMMDEWIELPSNSATYS